MTIRIAAPAKINLYLHVTGRRSDGYHELDSLVAFGALHDVITVVPASELTLTSDGPFAPALAAALRGGENLVLRAARLLAAHLGREPRVAIHLHKAIPVAAGLGGGSTDAAALLLALCQLWQAHVPLAILSDLSLRLGADLPVCLAAHTAFMAGIGERIEPAPEAPPLGVVLVNPNRTLATADVFRGLDGRFAPSPRPMIAPIASADTSGLIAMLRDCRNDLTAPAVALAPVIGEVLKALTATQGALLSRMSGSGATCFALYPTVAVAERAAAQFAMVHGDWWVGATRLIRGRDELHVD